MFDSFTRVLGDSKKNDDYGRYGVIGRENSGKSNLASNIKRFLQRNSKAVATVILSIIALTGLAIVYYILSFIFSFIISSNSDNTSSVSYTSSSAAGMVEIQSHSLGKVQSNKLDSLDIKLGNLINTYARANTKAGGINYKDLDKIDEESTELLHDYCMNELPFQLTSSSKYTILSHFTYFISVLAEGKHKIHDMNVGSTFITKDGTIIDSNDNKDFHKNYPQYGIDHAKCSLITALVLKAKSLPGIEGDDDNEGLINEFSQTDEQVWSQYQDKFKGINHDSYDAYQLIKLAKYDDDLHQFHVATQIIPELLNMHCPNAMKSKTFFDEEGKEMFVNAVHDIISQLHLHNSIELEPQEFPAFDNTGNIIAIDTFKFKTDPMIYGVDYLTCPFVEKIVYYHNVNAEQQVKELIEAIQNDATFAVDSKIDVMMIEHCENAVNVLKKSNTRIQGTQYRESIYRDIFIGEFKSFARKISEQRIIGNENYVITQNGGILPVSIVGKEKYYQCPLISLLTKQGNQNKFMGSKNEVNKQKHEFDPNFGNERLKDELNYQKIHDSKAHALIAMDHYLHHEDYEFHRTLLHYLYLHHKDIMSELRKSGTEKQDELFEHIEQYIQTLSGNEFTLQDFPETHSVYIEIQAGNPSVEMLDKQKAKRRSSNSKAVKLVESEFLSCLFKLALTQDVNDRTRIEQALDAAKAKVKNKSKK